VDVVRGHAGLAKVAAAAAVSITGPGEYRIGWNLSPFLWETD
jgi:hypothetical protein